MAGYQRRNSAEPESGVGAPPKVNVFQWKDVLVERSSDGRRENVGIIYGVSFRITVQYIEEGIEVVRVLVDVNNYYGPLIANTLTQALDSRPYGSQGVFSL